METEPAQVIGHWHCRVNKRVIGRNDQKFVILQFGHEGMVSTPSLKIKFPGQHTETAFDVMVAVAGFNMLVKVSTKLANRR